MQLQEVINAIKVSNFSSEEYKSVIDAVNYARSQAGQQTIRQLQVGDTVTFNGRRNKLVTGTVVKIKIKNVVVLDNATQTKWNVPASMLTLVSSAVK